MSPVTMHDAKTNLSRYVTLVESGEEDMIVISRGDKPAAMLVPFVSSESSQRLGVAAGKFDVPDDIDAHNDEIAGLFYGEAS